MQKGKKKTNMLVREKKGTLRCHLSIIDYQKKINLNLNKSNLEDLNLSRKVSLGFFKTLFLCATASDCSISNF
jgi:hypothetical protein